MKKLMLFLTLVILSKAYAYADNFNSFQLPNYPIEKGVSAPFAGFIGDWLIVGGGCNFPTKPAADGGSKVYYKECYAINTRSKAPEWTQITDLPLPVAYGCAVETTQGLVCIGGMNADSCLTSVFLIEPQKNKRGFSIRTLPSLPQTIDNASATAINNVIYITGGNQQNKGKSLFRFNLNSGTGWEILPSYPGPQRTQPILVNDRRHLYLAGGFQAPTKETESILSDDILCFNTERNQWEYFSEIPNEEDGEKRCLVGGAGTQTSTHFILTGGVNYTIFKNAIEGKTDKDYMRKNPMWYKFNDDVLFFNFKQKKWSVHPNTFGMARAGGILLYHNDCLYMICGEIKPGIRTPEIIILPDIKSLIR